MNIKWVEEYTLQDYLHTRKVYPIFISKDGAAAYKNTKAFKQAINDYSIYQCFKSSKKINK